MRAKLLATIAGAMLLALAAGCTSIPAEGPALPATAAPAAPTSAPTTPPEEAPVKENPTPTPAYDPAMEPLVQAAMDDLARRLGIPPEEIIVVEAQAVVWPDAAMGCPQPDMMYIQVPQDGAFIQLSAGGKTYNYHSGGSREVFLCEQTGKSGAPPTLEELQQPGGGGEDL